MELNQGFKKTDIGSLPSDWTVESLGKRLAGSPKYGINAAAVAYDSRFPTYLRITDITDEGRINQDSLASVIHPLANEYKLANHDVVFARTGASVGKSYLYQNKDGEFVYAGFLIRVRPERDKLYAPYLFYFSKSDQYWKWIRENSMRSGQPGVNGRQYSELPLPLPPTIKEQEAIANTLLDTDDYISSLEKLVAKKRLIKKGTMQELLTGKKRLFGFGKNSTFIQSEIGKIPSDWQVVTLGQIGKFKNGINKESEAFGHGFPFINLLDVFENKLISDVSTLGLLDSNSFERATYDLRLGDVLFIRSSVKPSGVGLTTLITANLDNAVYSGFLIRFRCNDTIALKYRAYCFSEEKFRARLISSSSVSANTNINQSSLSQLKIALPTDKCEQDSIAELLAYMDSDISLLERKIQKARFLRQGMMQQLLTGRIRLL